MNIAQMLAYGPKLIANPVSERAGEKQCKRYSPKMIERYKKYAIDGQIWSTLVSQHEKTPPANTSKNLKAMADDGILKRIGKVKECKASNKPILYRWNQ